MKTSASELKKRAKLSLSGHYGTVVGAMVIAYAAILVVVLVAVGVLVANSFSRIMTDSPYDSRGFWSSMAAAVVIYLIALLLVYLFLAGIRRMLYNLSTGKTCELGDMLFAFTHRPHRFLGIYLIHFFVSLLLGIPYVVVSTAAAITGYIPIMLILQILMYILQLAGIIVYSLYFGLTVIILTENPEKKVLACFRESAAIMRGNKGRFFYLELSFIGMMLLGIGSFGIGYLWIFPYMETTIIHFYLDLKAEQWREAPYYQEEPEYENDYDREFDDAPLGDPA